MSNLLEQASLVMIPSGYAEDIVYSEIPLDGSGDLQLTRASNGTRVNSAGLVEVCPWNLVQQSETFENSAWTKVGASVSANTTNAPNGTATADKLVEDTANSSHQLFQSVTLNTSTTYTYSVYLKASERFRFRIRFDNFATSNDVNVDLNTETCTSGSLTNIGNGWFQFSYSLNSLTGANGPLVSIAMQNASGNTTYTGDGTSGAFIWGAQLNIGSTAKPYFPTTDRLNVPRLTYQNGGGGCPSLLLEKQSTNLALYSEALSTNPNIVDGSTATANVYVSPDGTQNAMQFTETVFNDRHGFYQYTTVTAQTYTASIFTKQTGRRYIAFSSDMANGTNVVSYFDLETKSVVSSGSGYTCSIQDFGNGWLRLIVTLTVSAGAAGSRYVIWGGSPDGTTTTYTGSTSISQTFWGYQFEASSYPTSYIPTTSASATRVADAYSRSLSSITAGTAYINITDNVALGSVGTHLYGPFSITGASLGLHLSRPNNARLRLWTQASANVFQTTVTNLKLAITWDGTNVNVYQNGVKVVTNYSYALTNVNNLFSSTDLESSATISEIVLFNSVLTDAECISLTS
jgi:hypothetical protein